MESHFWQQRWQRGDIGFHQSATNPFLLAHFDQLNVPAGGRVFLPLCGKTRDLAWLLAHGYRVAGAELSQLAIDALFQELGVSPSITERAGLLHYRAPDIDLFVGDIFQLQAQQLGSIDAIYDRAALVALPAAMRSRYAAHLIQLSATAPQLLITYEYDQTRMDGPPFSVSAEEVSQHYNASYQLQMAGSAPVEGGLKGKLASTETAWLLNPLA